MRIDEFVNAIRNLHHELADRPETLDPELRASLDTALDREIGLQADMGHAADDVANPATNAWRVCAQLARATTGAPDGPTAAEQREPARRAAVVVGAEIAARISRVLGAAHREVWDETGTAGVLGATVTAGLLWSAPSRDTLDTALGIAASMTLGHRAQVAEALGAAHCRLARDNAVLAVALAARGFTASPTAIDGPRGLFAALGSNATLDAVIADLGRTWALRATAHGTGGSSYGSSHRASGSDGSLDLAARLAEFTAGVRLGALPASAVHAGRRSMANVVGLAVAAADHPAVEIVATTLDDLQATGPIRALGRRQPTSEYAAALIMGCAMHVEDFDDTHLRSVLHPGAPVTAAALAAAELVGSSGADVLAAVVAGIEVGCRVGNALGSGHFDRGWHVSGTVGHVAAAAAAAHVLGLDVTATTHALVIAGTQASGVTEQLGSMTKCLHVGRAAANGLRAAMLARDGLTTVPGLGIRGGYADALSPSFAPLDASQGLGRVWEVETNALKPYSCGIVSHPVIDAAIEARRRGIRADDIERVVLTVRPVVLEVMGVAEPGDGLQSKFSVYHCFAVGLLDGGAGPAQFNGERAIADDVVTLRRKLRVVVDPAMPKDACAVQIDHAGRQERIHIAHATGSVAAPMTDEQLHSKFALLVEPVLGADAAELLWQRAMRIDDLPNMDPLFDAAVQPGVVVAGA